MVAAGRLRDMGNLSGGISLSGWMRPHLLLAPAEWLSFNIPEQAARLEISYVRLAGLAGRARN